jgi:hypothetical protein
MLRVDALFKFGVRGSRVTIGGGENYRRGKGIAVFKTSANFELLGR